MRWLSNECNRDGLQLTKTHALLYLVPNGVTMYQQNRLCCQHNRMWLELIHNATDRSLPGVLIQAPSHFQLTVMEVILRAILEAIDWRWQKHHHPRSLMTAWNKLSTPASPHYTHQSHIRCHCQHNQLGNTLNTSMIKAKRFLFWIIICMGLFVNSACYYLVPKSRPTLLRCHGLYPDRLLCPWDFPGMKTGVGCHFLLQGIFLNQGLNSHLLHYRQILHHWTTSEVLSTLYNLA